MTNVGYLFAAFAAVWVGIFLYVRRVAGKSRELEEEVRDLRSRLR